MRVNSRQYPGREIEKNFAEASRNYSRAYIFFQKAVKKSSDTDLGSQVTVEDFANLYPIIHVNVSKHKEKLKTGTADLEIQWQLASNLETWKTMTIRHIMSTVVLTDRYTWLEG